MTASADIEDNPTRHFIAEAVAHGRSDVSLHVNQAFATLDAWLIGGTPGHVRVRFSAGADMVQGNSAVFGGAFASMLDAAMAVAVLSALDPGETCSTINLNVSMMRGGGVGFYFAEAELEKRGRRVAFARAELADAEGKTVATGTSSLLVY